MGIQKLDQFLAGFIKTKIADKDGDGKLSKEEESIFKYSDSGKDLVDSLNFTEKGKYTGIDWSNVNDVLSENDFSRFTTDMAMSASQMMMKIDTDGNGQIFDNIDKDGNGTLSEEEIQAAIDSDMNLKNIFGIFGNRIPEGESAQNIFSFENMQRYAELVNISLDTVGDNRYTISDKEARSFGQLISSEETTINDETVSQERLLDIMQKYISTGFASAGADTSMLSELKHHKTRSVEYEKTVSGCTMSAEYEILPNGEKLSQIHFVSTINGHEYYIPAIEGLNPDDIVRISFLGDTTFAVQTSDNKVRLFRADTREVVDGKPVRTFKADDVETFNTLAEYRADRIAKVSEALEKAGLELGTGASAITWHNTNGYQIDSCKDKDGNDCFITWRNGQITKIEQAVNYGDLKDIKTYEYNDNGSVNSTAHVLKFDNGGTIHLSENANYRVRKVGDNYEIKFGSSDSASICTYDANGTVLSNKYYKLANGASFDIDEFNVDPNRLWFESEYTPSSVDNIGIRVNTFYQMDSDGNRVLDDYGNPIIEDGYGNVVPNGEKEIVFRLGPTSTAVWTIDDDCVPVYDIANQQVTVKKDGKTLVLDFNGKKIS